MNGVFRAKLKTAVLPNYVMEEWQLAWDYSVGCLKRFRALKETTKGLINYCRTISPDTMRFLFFSHAKSRLIHSDSNVKTPQKTNL